MPIVKRTVDFIVIDARAHYFITYRSGRFKWLRKATHTLSVRGLFAEY